MCFEINLEFLCTLILLKMSLILYHSFFLSHEWKETEKMHFSVLFAIQESFKFPFFCALSLSHVISSCTWHSLQHVWQFHFQTGSTSKRKELPIQFVNHQEKSHFWSKLKFHTNETFSRIFKHCVRLYTPFHWNWNACWCFHKRENASRCFEGWEK